MVGLAIFVMRYRDPSLRVQFVKNIINDPQRRYIPLAPSLGKPQTPDRDL
jgi:hypothetical protein